MLKQKLLSLSSLALVAGFFVFVCLGVLDEGHQEQARAHDKAARWAAKAP